MGCCLTNTNFDEQKQPLLGRDGLEDKEVEDPSRKKRQHASCLLQTNPKFVSSIVFHSKKSESTTHTHTETPQVLPPAVLRLSA